jgi:hypothetical protein
VVLAVAAAVFLVVVRPFSGGEQRPPAPPTTSPSVLNEAPLDAQGRPYRPFRDHSWWNSPVPVNAPHNPD